MKTNERRKKLSYSSAILRAKRDRKRREAEARNANLAPFQKLTVQEQIDWFYADSPGHGREITRRQKQLAINEGLWPVKK